MKNSVMFRLASNPTLTQIGRIVTFVGALAASGCHNYTAAPLCTEQNLADPPGLTGTYTFSSQDSESFKVTSRILTIEDAKSWGSVFDDEQETKVCWLQGQYISESWDEDQKAYRQERIFVTSMGITILPIFFDKEKLDDAGIPNEIRPIKTESKSGLVKIAGQLLNHLAAFSDDASLGLFIDNRPSDNELLMQASATGPVGVTLLRK